MNEALSFLIAFLAGLLIGVAFFGGLWWTVRKGLSSARPARWLLASLLIRMTILVAGLYFVGRGEATRLLLCLVGILVARSFVMRLTRPPQSPEGSLDGGEPREIPHAP